MARVRNRDIVWLQCEKCNRKNYTTYKRTKGMGITKLELKKYCKWCKSHTIHKERKKT